MQRLIRWSLALGTLVVLCVSIAFAQDDEVTFTVYRDTDSLSIMFTGTEAIPFHSIRIDVYRALDDVDEIFLRDYRTFQYLERDMLVPPTCLRFKLRNSDMPWPRDCRLLDPPQQREYDNLGRIDIFWYNNRLNEYFDLEFFQDGISIGECAADEVEDETCEITFTPTPMSTASNTTLVPPTTLIPLPTATLTAASSVGSNPPVIVNASTTGGCPTFQGAIDWQDADSNIVGVRVFWPAGSPNNTTRNFSYLPGTTSGRWTQTTGLQCTAPSGGGCFVRFQLVDAVGNTSAETQVYHTCP